MKRKYKASYLLATSILVISLCFAGGCLKESSLYVSEIHATAEHVGPASVTLNITSLVKNTYGYPQGPATVTLRAFDSQSGLLVDEKTTPAGTIGRSESRTVSQAVTLQKKGSYRFEVAVFERDIPKASEKLEINNLELLPADTGVNTIDIRDIDFRVTGVSADKATIDVGVYFTNTGSSPSLPCDVEIRAREKDARLTADRQWVKLDAIPKESTVIAGSPITVPDKYNYEVDVLIWKNGSIVKEGQGLVQLRPGTAVPAGTQFTTRSVNTTAFIAQTIAEPRVPSQSLTKSPGFESLLAVAALLGCCAFMVVRRKRP